MENTFLKDMKEWEKDPEYLTEYFILEINEQICEWMEKKNVSRAELAKRLGKSRSYVTRMLNGSHNLTIGTLVKIANALDAKPEIFFASSHSFGRNIPESEIDFDTGWDSLLMPNFLEPSARQTELQATSSLSGGTETKDTEMEASCEAFANAA